MLAKSWLISLLVAMPGLALADPALQVFLDQTLAAARTKNHLPAVAAMIQIEGKVQAAAVQGVRMQGHPEPATLNDRWHIGSDTKAFTATMIARLVEKQVMSFDDTLARALPALAGRMHPAYRDITIKQLLSHTAGLPPLTEDKDLPAFLAVIKPFRGLKEQRAAVARWYLSAPPASKAGEFEYSNLGYIIVGAIAELHTGESWESLVREQVFAPLGIQAAGFGEPGMVGSLDQPRGHLEKAGALTPVDPDNSDNPPAIGPAGMINIALKDWMLFAQDQLDGIHGHGKLLTPSTYRTLHTPVSANYALGWGVKSQPDGSPLFLTHSGSNGFWVADIRIMPKHDIITLLVMNSGDDAANTAIQDIGKPLKDRLKPFD